MMLVLWLGISDLIGVFGQFNLSLFFMAEENTTTVMAENKSSLIRDDDMPKSITSKRLNGLNYLAWTHAVKVNLCGKKKLN